SATMNMVGNIGSAVSAIIFPFFISHVTIPFFVSSTGTANSFFVFAATMNLLAIGAWLGISTRPQTAEIDRRDARRGMIILLLVMFSLAAGALLYKFLNP